MRTMRGENSGEKPRDPTHQSSREKRSGQTLPVVSTETAAPLTPSEEAELDGVFSGYDAFVSSLRRSGRETFDPCRAVLPLREALNTANLLVDCMRQSQLPVETDARVSLREHVLDCEEKAADLIGRLSRLRRTLKKSRTAPAP